MVQLPVFIRGVIVGLLLSDAWMQKQHANGEARIGMKQSLANLSYLCQVFSLLAHYCKLYPYFGVAKAQGVSRFPFVAFTTRSLACFTELYYQFYVNGKKCVPEDIYNLLTIPGLVHWICGDGSFAKGGGLILNTQSFTVIDVVRLINVLIIKFNCKCTIHYPDGQPVIYVSVYSIRKLLPQLLPHMTASMHYKLIGRLRTVEYS